MRKLILAGVLHLCAASAGAACPQDARRQTISTTTFSVTACIIDLDEHKDESVIILFVKLPSGGAEHILIPDTVQVYAAPLEITDFNFDGFPDIVLRHDCPASRACEFRTYLYSFRTRSFRYSEEFSSPKLANCSPMVDERIIRCDIKCSAEDYINKDYATVEYKVVKGRPVKTYDGKHDCPPVPPPLTPNHSPDLPAAR